MKGKEGKGGVKEGEWVGAHASNGAQGGKPGTGQFLIIVPHEDLYLFLHAI
jgi:hypothetical protein